MGDWSNECGEWCAVVKGQLSEAADISNVVMTHLELCARETSKCIEFLLKTEKEPSTENKHYFKDYRRKFLAFYNGQYQRVSNDSFIDRLQRNKDQSSRFSMALNSIIENLAIIGFRDVEPLELAVLQPSEDAEDALKIMADVRAYFQGMRFGYFLPQL
jgi:hypothetical protein